MADLTDCTDEDLIAAIDLTEELLAKRAEAEAALKSAFIELSSARLSRSGRDAAALLKADFYPANIERAPRVVDLEESVSRLHIENLSESEQKQEPPILSGSLRRRAVANLASGLDEGGALTKQDIVGSATAGGGNSYIRSWLGKEPTGALEKARIGFVQALNAYIEVASFVRRLRAISTGEE